MPLTAGVRLGPYDIVAPLGAGGMGEVYRARDTRLDRIVAIKILSDALAADPQFRDRFAREARTISQLAHPNICALFDIGHHDGIDFLVFEFLEGETLADRLQRSGDRVLPLPEALAIAIQIAAALAAAHRAGIVHRDLKPGNVMLTKSGAASTSSPQAKLLDFGLAKTAPAASVVRPSVTDLTSPPTMTSPLTMAGSIVGTFQYMSPEQLEGVEADARSDLFAFGAVLYELLTGKKAFTGKSQVSLMAAILDQDPPPVSSVQPTIPPALERVVKKCLVKDPEARWQNARDVQSELEWIAETLAQPLAATTSASASDTNRRHDWLWIAAAVVMTALGAGVTWLVMRQAPAHQQPIRMSVQVGIDGSLTGGAGGNGVALSPDGSLLAFVAQTKIGKPQLYVRRMDQLQSTPLAGTEEASSPFFSPDGRWIGFFGGEKLKKVMVTGGATVAVADAPSGRGAWWADDDTIVFEPAREGATLMRISSSGGQPTPIGALADGEVTQRWPQVLPGGQAVLFTTNNSAAGGFYNASLVVQRLPAGPRTVVHRGGSYGRYVASGHLIYISEGTLFAAPFNLDRLEVTGQAVPVIERVVANAGSGSAHFAVSDRGTIVYATGEGFYGAAPMSWVDRQGRVTPLRSTPENWTNPRFSPDGSYLAVDSLGFSGRSDVWILDWTRDTLTRLTSDSESNGRPVWTPDGRRIVFSSDRATRAVPNLYWRRVDGTGDVQRLTESSAPQAPGSWHPSGRFLAFHEGTPSDLFILPMEGDDASGWKPGKPTAFVTGPYSERDPMFSPDGRWIAYSSDESGRNEIYVRPFPGPGGRMAISSGGGVIPTWSRKRNELFYSTSDRQIMIAPYHVAGDVFRADKPQLWAPNRYVQRGGPTFRSFDLHPDGERFALSPAAETSDSVARDSVVFVFNFFDELRRVAAAKR